MGNHGRGKFGRVSFQILSGSQQIEEDTESQMMYA